MVRAFVVKGAIKAYVSIALTVRAEISKADTERLCGIVRVRVECFLAVEA